MGRLLWVLVAVGLGCESGSESSCVPTDDAGNHTACWAAAQHRAYRKSNPIPPTQAFLVECDKEQVVYLKNAGCSAKAEAYWETVPGYCTIIADGCLDHLCEALDGSTGTYVACQDSSGCPAYAPVCRDMP
jgi:hypothetical protein